MVFLADLDAGRVLDYDRPAVQAKLGAVVELGAADAEKRIVIEIYAGLVCAAEGHSLAKRCYVLPVGFECLGYTIVAGNQVADTPEAGVVGHILANFRACRAIKYFDQPAWERTAGAIIVFVAADAQKLLVAEVLVGDVGAVELHRIGYHFDGKIPGPGLLGQGVVSGLQIAELVLAIRAGELAHIVS